MMILRCEKIVVAAILVASVCCATRDVARAHEHIVGKLKIEHCWVRAAEAGSTFTTAYAIEIVNDGDTADRLIGGSLEKAGTGILRGIVEVNGKKEMRPVDTGLTINPHSSIELVPGQKQIFFDGLKSELKEGEHARGTLVFEKAGTVPVEFMVEPSAAASDDDLPAPKMNHQMHDHKNH